MKVTFEIGDKVRGLTARGEFKGIVAEINNNGTLLIGAKDGTMIEIVIDRITLDRES